MTTAYSTLMGLAEPVQGELSGTWGDTVNKGITEYLDIALAGTQTISGSQTAVTLSLTNGNASATNIAQAGSGATGSAQYALINCTGNPAGLLTITAPASSRQYIVINATSTSQSVKIVGTGPTTGVTIVSGEKAIVAWNGTDYVKVSSSLGTGDVVGPASATDSALVAFNGTTGKLIKQAATITVAQGGTGLSSGTSGGIPYYSGTTTIASSAALAANAIVLGGGAGVAPATTATGTGVVSAIGNNTNSASGLAVLNASGLLAVAQGGTNANATPAAGAVAYGTGTAYAFTAAGSAGQVLQSNGTSAPTWVNAATGNVTAAGNNAFTGANTFYNATGQTFGTATSTQDGIIIAGRAGGSSSYRVTLTPTTLSASRTLTLPDATDTVAVLGTAQTFTAAQTFRAANAIRSEAASTQDAIVIAGRAGGTSSYALTFTPDTLSASRTVTFPDGGGNYTVGYRNLPAVGTKTGSYILATADVGKYVQVSTGGSITIPDATFAEGDAITIFNNTTGNITITCSITTAYIAGADADKATMTLATRGVATVLFISGTVCVVSGNVS